MRAFLAKVRAGDRRHGHQGASGGLLQGHHLPVRPDRHLCPVAKRCTTCSLRATTRYRLPHKFKIAVGGCPNNCVKPDLNDLGIIGQRVPALRSRTSAAAARRARWRRPAPSAPAKLDGRQAGLSTRALATTAAAASASAPSTRSSARVQRLHDLHRRPLGQAGGRRAAPWTRFSPTRRRCWRWWKRRILLFRDAGHHRRALCGHHRAPGL